MKQNMNWVSKKDLFCNKIIITKRNVDLYSLCSLILLFELQVNYKLSSFLDVKEF